MSDEKKPEEKKTEHLREYAEEAQEKAVAKLQAIKAVKQLSNGDSPWTLTQEMFQEIMAGHTVANPDKLPPLTQMVEELKAEIDIRYKDEPETAALLLNSIPTMRSVREWVKKDGWEEAVWGKIRADGLFTATKRAKVIESLRLRAEDKSDVAAKIWLTLSGDYSEKMEVNEKSVDLYREINKVLHGKKDK